MPSPAQILNALLSLPAVAGEVLRCGVPADARFLSFHLSRSSFSFIYRRINSQPRKHSGSTINPQPSSARREAAIDNQTVTRRKRRLAPIRPGRAVGSASTASATQQPAHSPHNEDQYRNRNNRQQQKVMNGIGKNVIRMSRIEAVEAIKRGWQCC